MTRYDSAAWATKARKRKAYRDHTRDAFFKAVGAKKNLGPQDLDGAPQSQKSKVADLLKLTAKGSVLDSAQKDMIARAATALAKLDLGAGDKGGSAKTEATLRQYSMRNLRDNWFKAPAFFD